MIRIKLSRLASAVLASLLLAGGAAAVAGAQAASVKRFADVKPGAWYESSVSWALAQGIVLGYPDGTFRPGAPLTEAEFMTMLLKQAGQPLRAKQPGEPWYAPVYEQAEAWLHREIRSEDAGNPQTRGKAAVLIAAALGRPLDENAAVRFLLVEGIAKGRSAQAPGDFAPAATMTRAEAVSFMQRIADYAAKQRVTQPPKEEPQRPAIVGPIGSGGAQGGGSSSGGNDGNGNGGNSGPNRPNSPPPSADNLQERAAQLAQRIDVLGLSMEQNGRTLSVAHPSGQGNGALLIPASEETGAVQILDVTDAACLEAAHALLQYAGISIDRTVFSNTLAAVMETGNNAALKVGNQVITFQRANTPGQITIPYAKY